MLLTIPINRNGNLRIHLDNDSKVISTHVTLCGRECEALMISECKGPLEKFDISPDKE